MKRIIAIVLLALCCTALFACDTQQEPTTEYSGTKEEQICAYARDVIAAEIEALIGPIYGVSMQSIEILSCQKTERIQKIQVDVVDEKTGLTKKETVEKHLYDYYAVTALVTYYNPADNKTYVGNYDVDVFYGKDGEMRLEGLAFGGIY